MGSYLGQSHIELRKHRIFTYVVSSHIESTCSVKAVPGAKEYGSSQQDLWRHSSLVALPPLRDSKESNEHHKQDQQEDDAPVAPRVDGTTPLEGKYNAHNAWQKE